MADMEMGLPGETVEPTGWAVITGGVQMVTVMAELVAVPARLEQVRR